MKTRLHLSTPLAVLLAALLLCACGKPRNVVLLLPDPDGKVGQVTVSTAQGSQTLAEGGLATRVPAAGAAPTAPERLSAQEEESLFGAARRALPKPPQRFLLYFETDTANLTAESQRLLPGIIQEAKDRQSRDISVVGHTNRSGSPEYNRELSRRRAERVKALLEKAGIAPEIMEISHHGAAVPLVPDASPHEPRNRRVEVLVR